MSVEFNSLNSTKHIFLLGFLFGFIKFFTFLFFAMNVINYNYDQSVIVLFWSLLRNLSTLTQPGPVCEPSLISVSVLQEGGEEGETRRHPQEVRWVTSVCR